MDKYEQASQTAFNEQAATYDDDHTGVYTQRYKELLIEEAERARILHPGIAVLDIACGTGTFLQMLSERYNINGYGIDIAGNMLALAREKNPSFHFAEGTAAELSFLDDSSIDLVTVSAAFHHFPDPEAFMREAARVLKPRGTIMIADPYIPKLLRPLAFLLPILSKDGDKKMYFPRQMDALYRMAGLDPRPTRITDYIQICSASKPEEQPC